MQAYAGSLFDLDGTLIDTAPDLHAALCHCLASHGLQAVSEQDTRHWVGHGARAMIRHALVAQGTQEPAVADQVEQLLPSFLDYYRQHPADASQPYPGVVDTLHTLRQRGARLAVVTNKMFAMTGPILDAFHITELFDSVIGGDTAAHPKPHAAPIDLALTQLQLAPDKVLFVGDSETDVGAARAANVDVVCVPYGYNQGRDVAELKPDGVIDSFAELL